MAAGQSLAMTRHMASEEVVEHVLDRSYFTEEIHFVCTQHANLNTIKPPVGNEPNDAVELLENCRLWSAADSFLHRKKKTFLNIANVTAKCDLYMCLYVNVFGFFFFLLCSHRLC